MNERERMKVSALISCRDMFIRPNYSISELNKSVKIEEDHCIRRQNAVFRPSVSVRHLFRCVGNKKKSYWEYISLGIYPLRSVYQEVTLVPPNTSALHLPEYHPQLVPVGIQTI